MTQYSSLIVKLSNSQLNKLKSAIENETEAVLRLSGEFLSRLLGPLLKTGLSLIKNVIKPLVKVISFLLD